MNYSKQLSDLGVIHLREVIPQTTIEAVRAEYDETEPTLINRDIPRDRPCVVFWRHVEGEKKRIATFDRLPMLHGLVTEYIVPTLVDFLAPHRLQLLETIIFDKPPKVSNTLHWHQDVAYFPLKPNNQLAVWIPFQPVTDEQGAMRYALRTHKLGVMGSTNLHNRTPFDGETRPLIPDDPQTAGYSVVTYEINPTDMLVHDGYTWHCSGPNKTDRPRRGLSVRFITDAAVFDPRPGQGAAFTQQIDVQPGETVQGAPFPVMWPAQA